MSLKGKQRVFIWVLIACFETKKEKQLVFCLSGVEVVSHCRRCWFSLAGIVGVFVVFVVLVAFNDERGESENEAIYVAFFSGCLLSA